MPPFVAFAGVLGGLAVVRWAYKTAVRINQELEEMRLSRVAETARVEEIQTLKRDPVTGAYRPGWAPFFTPSFRGARKREPEISRFRVRCFASPRNDGAVWPEVAPLCLDSLRRRRYGPARFKTPRESLT
jgi:hypothetical protein